MLFNFTLTPKDSDKMVYGAFYRRFVKIIFISFIVCSIPFFVLAIVKEPMFLVFTIFFIFPALFFGPYSTCYRYSGKFPLSFDFFGAAQQKGR